MWFTRVCHEFIAMALNIPRTPSSMHPGNYREHRRPSASMSGGTTSGKASYASPNKYSTEQKSSSHHGTTTKKRRQIHRDRGNIRTPRINTTTKRLEADRDRGNYRTPRGGEWEEVIHEDGNMVRFDKKRQSQSAPPVRLTTLRLFPSVFHSYFYFTVSKLFAYFHPFPPKTHSRANHQDHNCQN